ncbi:MAG: GHMP kinase, partial [Acidimicrobiia bacterium]|nr:GHMP kinase [Acidimicrobiia bacterium]
TGLDLPPEILPSIALRVETEQLNLTAGLQGRVVQTYGGLMAMNFGETTTDARFGVSHGEYHPVDSGSLPALFLAYRSSAARPSDRFHRVLRRRYEDGDSTIRELLHQLAAMALEGEAALRWNDGDRFAELLGENMRLRRQLGPVPDEQIELIDLAVACEAPATFAGSGGAIVGAYADDDHLARLKTALGSVDAVVVAL